MTWRRVSVSMLSQNDGSGLGSNALLVWDCSNAFSATLVTCYAPSMTPEDRDHMLELCRRITRETESMRLALWITELNELIQRKVDELKRMQG